MKTLITIVLLLLLVSYSQAMQISFTWNNITDPSYNLFGENVQDHCYGWYAEVIEYKGHYEFPHQGTVLGSGTIGPPNPATPFRILSIPVEVVPGTKAYLRVFDHSGNSINLGTKDGAPYYTATASDVGIEFESMRAAATSRISVSGAWVALTTSHIIHKGEHSFGDIIPENSPEIYPIMTGSTTNSWEIRYNAINFYPAPSNGYVFIGWTDDASGMDVPLYTTYEWHGKSIGALFTKIPTNFNVGCSTSKSDTNMNYHINFESKELFKYRVESTDSLSTNSVWKTCSTITAQSGTNTTWTHTFPLSSLTTTKYYRVIQDVP